MVRMYYQWRCGSCLFLCLWMASPPSAGFCFTRYLLCCMQWWTSAAVALFGWLGRNEFIFLCTFCVSKNIYVRLLVPVIIICCAAMLQKTSTLVDRQFNSKFIYVNLNLSRFAFKLTLLFFFLRPRVGDNFSFFFLFRQPSLQYQSLCH